MYCTCLTEIQTIWGSIHIWAPESVVFAAKRRLPMIFHGASSHMAELSHDSSLSQKTGQQPFLRRPSSGCHWQGWVLDRLCTRSAAASRCPHHNMWKGPHAIYFQPARSFYGCNDTGFSVWSTFLPVLTDTDALPVSRSLPYNLHKRREIGKSSLWPSVAQVRMAGHSSLPHLSRQ